MEASTRLELSTLKSPIRAVVSDRHAHGLTIEQALPFLRLDTAIQEDGARPAKIAGVSIRVDGDVPKLVVELEYTSKKRRDDTVPYAIERVEPSTSVLAAAPVAVTSPTMWERFMTLVAALRS